MLIETRPQCTSLVTYPPANENSCALSKNASAMYEILKNDPEEAAKYLRFKNSTFDNDDELNNLYLQLSDEEINSLEQKFPIERHCYTSPALETSLFRQVITYTRNPGLFGVRRGFNSIFIAMNQAGIIATRTGPMITLTIPEFDDRVSDVLNTLPIALTNRIFPGEFRLELMDYPDNNPRAHTFLEKLNVTAISIGDGISSENLIRGIGKCKNLLELDVDATFLDEPIEKYLFNNLNTLIKLTLRGYSNQEDDRQVNVAFIVMNCPNLKQLTLIRSGNDDASGLNETLSERDRQNLKLLYSLLELHVSDDVAEAIGNMQHITHLTTRISTKDAAKKIAAKKLEYLNLSRSTITKEILDEFKDSKALIRTLCLDDCSYVCSPKDLMDCMARMKCHDTLEYLSITNHTFTTNPWDNFDASDCIEMLQNMHRLFTFKFTIYEDNNNPLLMDQIKQLLKSYIDACESLRDIELNYVTSSIIPFLGEDGRQFKKYSEGKTQITINFIDKDLYIYG